MLSSPAARAQRKSNRMRAYLIRVGIDQAFGGWNAPMHPATNEFVFVPIPESRPMQSSLSTPYATIVADLARFEAAHPEVRHRYVRLPSRLAAANMHLD